MEYKDKKIAVLGLGVDTSDVIPWLESRGAKVSVLDEKSGDKFENLSRFDVLVRSPGVYRFRPEIIEAEKRGSVVTSKTKLFFENFPLEKIIGITGTKGKGTTATLIYEILKAGGKRVDLGGNIGGGIFSFIDRVNELDYVVLELSSFQLIDLDKSPHIAVVLMVTSEHQDWHKGAQEYVDSKKNIVKFQTAKDLAVVNRDYSNSVKVGESAKGQLVWVSKDALERLDDTDIGLRGPHNRENVVAAATVGKYLGVSEEIIQKVIKHFKGLPNRLEEVGEIRGIKFFNDSFSTTPETAIAAINSFTEPLIVILGGSSKNSDFTQLGQVVSGAANIKAVELIGLEGPRIGAYIQNKKVISGAKNMEEIVSLALAEAKSGDVVLLSPACASFDMFKNYKDRGEQFKDWVVKLGKTGN